MSKQGKHLHFLPDEKKERKKVDFGEKKREEIGKAIWCMTDRCVLFLSPGFILKNDGRYFPIFCFEPSGALFFHQKTLGDWFFFCWSQDANFNLLWLPTNSLFWTIYFYKISCSFKSNLSVSVDFASIRQSKYKNYLEFYFNFFFFHSFTRRKLNGTRVTESNYMIDLQNLNLLKRFTKCNILICNIYQD